MKLCRGCGSPLTKKSQQAYCSNKCQRTSERIARTQLWLESGQAVWTDGRRDHYIRLHLIEDQSARCAICGQANTWLDAPLSFVLDHIDSNASNNCRENLRLVCPNCDSQLPTYKAKNRGNGRLYRRQRYADGKSY